MKMIRVGSILAAIGVAGLVLAVAGAGPSSAAVTTVTSLPANVTIEATDTVSVSVTSSPVCAAGTTDFRAFSPGKQDAVTTIAACSGTTLTATVTPSASAKRVAVVKFTSTLSGQKVVQTLVVHVNKAKPGKPTSPGKPA